MENYVSTAIGNQLEFDEFDTIGAPKFSSTYDTTFAELTSVSRTPGTNVLVLVSQLRITIRSDVNPSSVTCVHDIGSTETITLRLLGMLLHVSAFFNVTRPLVAGWVYTILQEP